MDWDGWNFFFKKCFYFLLWVLFQFNTVHVLFFVMMIIGFGSWNTKRYFINFWGPLPLDWNWPCGTCNSIKSRWLLWNPSTPMAPTVESQPTQAKCDCPTPARNCSFSPTWCALNTGLLLVAANFRQCVVASQFDFSAVCILIMWFHPSWMALPIFFCDLKWQISRMGILHLWLFT